MQMLATSALTIHLIKSTNKTYLDHWWMVSVVANVNDRIDGNNSKEAANDFSPITPHPNI